MSEYHEDTTHLTKTALSVFCDSPQEYYLQFVAKAMPRKQPSKVMLVGTVLHSVLLENIAIEAAIAIYDESCLQSNGSLNWRTAAKFRDANPGKVCMKEADAEAIYDVYKAIQDTLIYEAIAQGQHFEKTFSADVHGMPCKCKPDIACDMGDYILLYDLKFMEQINPLAFQRSAKNFRYYLQDAHYSGVMRELSGKPVQFRFIAIETKLPYRVQPYWYIGQSREMARDFHKSKLIDLQACQRSGVWSDNWANEIVLHPWEIGGEVDELVEVGDEV